VTLDDTISKLMQVPDNSYPDYLFMFFLGPSRQTPG